MSKTTEVKLEEPEVLERIVDWDGVEADYRLGVASLRAIGDKYGCSESAIRKRAGKYKWVRDLTTKMRQRAEEMVRNEELRTARTPPPGTARLEGMRNTRVETTKAMRAGRQNGAQKDAVRTDDDRAYEADVIEVGAAAVATVLLSQKRVIERHAKLASSFLAELEGMTDLREDFEHLGELLYAPDEKGVDKLNDIYQKVIALPGRVDTFKKLSDTLKVLIGLQRQAVGLSDNSNGEADKSPQAPAMSDMEVARRMAFLLTKGVKEQA